MALGLTALGSSVPNKTPVILNGATGQTVVPQGGMVYLTDSGAGAYTLAAPAADGIDLYIISLTAYAHTVTTPANIVNGADDTLTYGAAALNYAHLVSFGGQWLLLDKLNVTLSEV